MHRIALSIARHGRIAVLLGVGLVATLTSAFVTPFHVRLLRTSPKADTTVSGAPTDVRLWFSEPTELAVTSLRVTSAKGVGVAVTAPTRDTKPDAPVIAAITGAMAPGRYTVIWRTMSHDGHAVHGTFAFTVTASKKPAS
jgi:methionine-rich copper-binding protein CopC